MPLHSCIFFAKKTIVCLCNTLLKPELHQGTLKHPPLYYDL